MFAERDQNRFPGAPSVKIPTLSSPASGTAAGSAYAPSLSLRKRFGPSAPTPDSRSSRRDAPHASMSDLCVHECDVPIVTVESPPPQDELQTLRDRRRSNELEKVERVVPLVTEVRDDDAVPSPQPDAVLTLQKDEFLERLVRRVRASCASVMQSAGGVAEDDDDARTDGCRSESDRRSPPPRRPSPTLPLADTFQTRRDADGGVDAEAEVPRARAPSRSRSPSPSLHASPSSALHGFTFPRAGAGRAVLETRGSPLGSPAAPRSGATSPDPRAPSTDLFAAGGALRSSLQHSRCSGVSRSRRSPSTERPAAAGDAAGAEEDGFWLRAAASTTAGAAGAGQRAPSLCSERGGGSVLGATHHPLWVPHPAPQSRPAWNQRQLPKKQRPVVSAPGSAPPPSTRRSISRSPERRQVAAVPTPGAQRGTTARAALRRSASLPSGRMADAPPTSPQHFSATAPRPSTHRPLSDAGAAATQSPITAVAVVAPSPPSPPSARALFQTMDTDSATRTVPSPNASPDAQAMRQVCDDALERAARAERQCSVLTLALEQLLVERAAEKAAWQARFAALETQMRSVTQWIASVDSEATVAITASQTASAPSAPADSHADKAVAADPSHGASAVPVLQPEVLMRKPSAWDGDEDEDAEISPLPGAPGATPTPARRGNTSSESHGMSSCQVRLPPSPPMILHMQSQP